MDYETKEQEILKMGRVQNIFQHPTFQSSLEHNQRTEQTRFFCRHDMTHFLDTARLAYIFSLERGLALQKDVIYAAGLLHDIGRWVQYQDGTPHDEASASLAEPILKDSGFSSEECQQILGAIRCHRSVGEADDLAQVLYDADKASRSCYLCPAQSDCNWDDRKKNLNLTW